MAICHAGIAALLCGAPVPKENGLLRPVVDVVVSFTLPLLAVPGFGAFSVLGLAFIEALVAAPPC